MDFQEVKQKVVQNALDYGEQFNVTIDQDFSLLKLSEEMGEFAQAVLIHRKKSRPEKFKSEAISKEHVAEELADVIGMALVNAHVFDIDIEAALKKKWIKDR